MRSEAGIFASQQAAAYLGRKVPLTIQTAAVTGDHADMPVLLTEANLPSEIWSLALDGGGDLRLFAESALSTVVPLEVVLFDMSGQKAVIWAKLPNVRNSAGDVYYLKYDGVEVAQPAANAAGGSQAVWSGFSFVSHDLVTEVTSHGYSLTSGGGTAAQNGPFGNVNGARGFGTTYGGDATVTDDKITTGKTDHATQRTFMAWVFLHGAGGGSSGRIIEKAGAKEIWNRTATGPGLQWQRAFSGGNANWISANGYPALDTWVMVAVAYDGGAATNDPALYLAGASQTLSGDTNSTGTASTDAGAYVIGNRGSDGNRVWDGMIAELWMADTILSADWLATRDSNQSAPGSFISAGTPVNV